MIPALAALLPMLIEKGIDLFDKKFESESEKIEAKKQYEIDVTNTIHNANMDIQSQLTERHKNDMQSDSWLSKNIRPLTLIYLMCLFTYAFVAQVDEFVLDMLKELLLMVFGFYFLARGAEKITKILKGN